MDEDQKGQENTSHSTNGMDKDCGNAQQSSHPGPAWLTHIPRFPIEHLPRAPASFVYESIQQSSNHTQTSGAISNTPTHDEHLLLNHHPSYISSLDSAQSAVPRTYSLSGTLASSGPLDLAQHSLHNSTSNSSETLDAIEAMNGNALPRASLENPNQISLLSDIYTTSNPISRGSEQAFPHNFTAVERHLAPPGPQLPTTFHPAWLFRDTDVPSANVAFADHSSQTAGLTHWQSDSQISRFPLAPQNIEYEEGISQVLDLPHQMNSEETSKPFSTAIYSPVVHALPINHRVSGITHHDHSSETENSPEVDVTSGIPEVVLTTGKKRKHSETEEGSRPAKRRTGIRGRPRGRRNLEGPRSVLDPGLEFSRLYSAAMDAFIEENDAPKAQAMILQAIGVNPEIFAAHSLLADIYFSQGNHEAAIDALMIGLHAHINDVELWRQVADTILNDHTEGYKKRVERAMYCFSGILRKNSKDLDARFQRAECARVLGNWNKAFSDLNILLQDDPHNSTVLAQFMRVCQGVGDISQAKILYEDHFDHYATVGISEEDHFTWQDISNYIDILTQIGQTAKAVSEFKRLARWLCGRQTETYWEDFVEDDREFDQMHYPRRLEVPQFEPGKFDEQEYGEAIPLDLRGKLGVLRLKLSFREEAQAHFDWLEPELEGEDSLVYDYSDTFFEIATSLLDVKEYKIALQFYDAIHKAGIDFGYDFWLGLAACCFVAGRIDESVQHYEHALEISPNAIEPRTQLAKLHNGKGDRTKALKYGREAVLLAQNAIPATMNRKYERREQRVVREAAVKALQMAYRMPVAPGKAPGRVPDDLKRGRRSRRFVTYVPRYTERPQTVETSSTEEDDGAEEEDDDDDDEERHEKEQQREEEEPNKEPLDLNTDVEEPVEAGDERGSNKDKLSTNRKKASRKIPNTPKRPRFPKPPKPAKLPNERRKPKLSKPRRQPPSQEDVLKHYEAMQQLYHTLLNHQDAMRGGDDAATLTWMDCADALVKDFRTVNAFYPAERHKKFEMSDKGFPLPPASLTAPQTSTSTPGPSPSQSQQEEQIPFSPPTNSAAQENVPNLDRGLFNEYCGIPFYAWLDIHLEFALLIANSANRTFDTQKECYDILTSTTDCAIYYHDERSMIQIHVCWLVCALALGDDVTLFNHVLRWFMREFSFCTDAYRLYSAIGFLNELPSSSNGKAGQVQSAEFKSSPNQKFVFRQVVSIDKLLPANYNIDGPEGGVPAFMRRHREELRKISRNVDFEGIDINDGSRNSAQDTPQRDGEEGQITTMTNTGDNAPNEPIDPATPNPVEPSHQQTTIAVKVCRPKEMDAVLFVLYAHILMASNSFPNALSYLYRAYSIDPTNPVILLSMSFCYMHELFKRQNENRHMYVLYGWAWFGRYESERLAWAERFDKEKTAPRLESAGKDQNTSASAQNDNLKQSSRMVDIVKDEVEFNKARCWEMLGMADLAIRGYTKVLKPSAPVQSDEDRSTNSEDWSMEAAYAMSTIYAINGNTNKAREITERYLVVE